MPPELTPMLRQYWSIKEKHPTELLLFRLGDFYEMFGEDAKKASAILEIVLTARNKGTPNEIPMCGIPHHALDNYLVKFMKAGQRVAICDQLGDPNLPGLVEREVTRVITPGTTVDDATLQTKSNNYIVALVVVKNIWGLALADLTTGEFQLAEIGDLNILKNEVKRFNPSELIVAPQLVNELKYQDFFHSFRNVTARELSRFEKPYDILTKHFNQINLQSFGVENLEAGIEAAGLLFSYLKETQKTGLAHITKLGRHQFADFMILDDATARNLEIYNTAATFSYEGSLLSILDKTTTSLGGRMLRRWLALPLLNEERIRERHEAVSEIVENRVLMRSLLDNLKQCADLERLLGKIGCGRANARDFVALKNSLLLIPEIKKSLQVAPKSPLLKSLETRLGAHNELVALLEKSFHKEPPLSISEGGFICDGYDTELDDLRAISKHGKEWLAEFQAREIQRSGINSLKVKFNNVFGYYIEISNANRDQVPLDYTRKQTLVNAERFITPELKEYEDKILGAEDKIHAIEYRIFNEIVKQTLPYFSAVQQAAEALACLDVLTNFALIAIENNYARPEINQRGEIDIKNGRHPVIERFQPERYVANDLRMNHEHDQFILLTGPNMSGKSSFLRQAALISLLAQIGSFVPAEEATLGIVDRIFTRVGASDNLAQGVSTFMVEMQEAANILNNATKDSLIILDELGRGTSTYDGVSLAWAISEYIHDHVGAKTIFATHYHELTEVIEKFDRGANYCVAVSERDGNVVFLHKIIRGASSQSYGIEVAKLAGLPQALILRANELLQNLENKQEIKLTRRVEQVALPLAMTTKDPLREELAGLDPDNMTPMEALNRLHELKGKI